MGAPTYVATQSLCVTFTHCDFGLSLCFPFTLLSGAFSCVILQPLGIDMQRKISCYAS